MSIQGARDFLNRVGKDEGFRKQLGRCTNRTEQQQLAQSLGFEFSADEMKTAAGELQDVDLDGVSGGNCCGFTCEPEHCAESNNCCEP